VKKEQSMAIREAIIDVTRRGDLSRERAAAVMEEMMTGVATPGQIGAFLTALALKGETEDELAGLAEVMRAHAVPVDSAAPLLDTCGTGGDHSGTFNISTAAAFVAAGAGARVAKHGNRAMSSVCGSADVLEGLGVRIDLDAAGVAHCLAGAGIGFMLAPRFHPALRFAGPVRREIGIRTAFNLLGPLCNPARAQHQVIGVPQAALVPVIARTLVRLEAQHALVVHGHGGMDELTLSDDNLMLEVVRGQEPIPLQVDLAALGLRPAGIAALRGGDVATNAAIVRAILVGDETGPRRDVVLLNAAAALLAADIAGDLAHGVTLARQSITSGAAAERLARLVALSNA
jgi:anthranilate phosphoribosyltransferase